MIREFDRESSSHQTASSAIESGMFPYIMEKRRNQRVGRDLPRDIPQVEAMLREMR
jgi:hypothetical protein